MMAKNYKTKLTRKLHCPARNVMLRMTPTTKYASVAKKNFCQKKI